MVKNLKGSLTITCRACGHRVTWSVGEAEVRQLCAFRRTKPNVESGDAH
jgi:hypothetical protein